MGIYEKLLKSYGSSKDKAKSDVEILLAKPDIIKAIKKLYTVDKLGYRTITRLLNEEYSKSFTPKTIRTTERFFAARGIGLPDGYIFDGMNEKGERKITYTKTIKIESKQVAEILGIDITRSKK